MDEQKLPVVKKKKKKYHGAGEKNVSAIKSNMYVDNKI